MAGGEGDVGQDGLAIAGIDIGAGRGRHIGDVELGQFQGALHGVAAMHRHDQHAGALAPRPPVRPERCSSVSGLVGISAWMTRSRFGRSMPRAATSVATQMRRGRRAWIAARWCVRLAELAREGDDVKAAIMQARGEVFDAFAGGGEDRGCGAIEIEQRIDDGILALGGGDQHQLVVDIVHAARRHWLPRCAGRRSGRFFANWAICLERSRENRACGDLRAAASRMNSEVFAEAEVEHFVGFGTSTTHGGRTCRARPW